LVTSALFMGISTLLHSIRRRRSYLRPARVRVWGLGCRVWGLGCRVWGLGCGV